MLVAALSVDLMVAGIAYGSNRIAISPFCAGIINIISTACLGAALCLGTLIDKLIPEKMTVIICFVSLFVIGLWRITAFVIKRYIKRGNRIKKHYMFSMLNLDFVIYVSGNPVAADQDNSSQALSGRSSRTCLCYVVGWHSGWNRSSISKDQYSDNAVQCVYCGHGHTLCRLCSRTSDRKKTGCGSVLAERRPVRGAGIHEIKVTLN